MKFILIIVLLTLNTDSYEILHVPYTTIKECIIMKQQIIKALSKELTQPNNQYLAASRCVELK